MSAWQAALETALVGVARKPWHPPPEAGELAAVLRESQTDEAASSLLRSLAVLSVYRRAGEMPVLDPAPAIPPAAAETLPVCGPRVTFHLGQILSRQFSYLLPWTLGQLAEMQVRVPPPLLPQLLNLGSVPAGYHHRDSLRRVCGERGRWLASLNPSWSWLLTENGLDVALWETGSVPQRLAVLRQMRRTDPEGALSLLQSTWKQDKADLRVQFLSVLREGLSSHDEAFLEACLDDRHLGVRQAAAELLASLPDSAYVQRMWTRLTAIVEIEFTFLRRLHPIKLTLPDTDDPALVRDGIKGQSVPGGLGEKASAAAQMIGVVPPSFWTAQHRVEPTQLLNAAAAGEWKDLLWRGWQEGTKRHRDPKWAQALANTLPFESLDAETLALLTPAERDRLGTQYVRDHAPGELLRVIPRFPGPWSMPFTQIVIGKCLTLDSGAHALAYALGNALLKMPPETAALITPQWPAHSSELATGLEFYRSLHAALVDRL